MRREICICLLLAFLSIQLYGQTILYPGDMAIVGIQTDNPDDFSFVFLISIQKHTVVYFTDCGVKVDGSFRNGEGGLRYTAPCDLAPGTLVNYIRDSAEFSKANDPLLGNRGFNLSSSGDQIIAFQDSSIRPRYLFALQTNSSKWQNECTNSNVSCLPPGLKEGYSAICVGKDTVLNHYWHNAALKFVPSGKNKDKTLTELCWRNNWTYSNSIIPLPAENLNLVPDSNRYIKLLQDTGTIFFINDSLRFDVIESNIGRLSIWFKNMNLKDSFILQNNWPVAQKKITFKFPPISICDSFQYVVTDADFPGFLCRSKIMVIKDTIPLRFIELNPKLIKPGDSIILTFNKAMLPLCDWLVIRNQVNHSDSIILRYSSGEISIYGAEVILNLPDAHAGTTYDIEIKQGWMSDLKGNPFHGMDKDSYPVFEVMREIIPDSLAPILVSTDPSLDEPISLDQKIRFVFNEPLYSQEGDITDPDVLGDIISVQDINGDNFYDFIIEFDSLFTSFSILPIGLEEGKAYFIAFYGFSDSIGNECDEFIFTFEIEKSIKSGNLTFSNISLLAYPNPVQNYLQIVGSNFEQSKIEILDICGRPGNVQIIERSNDKIILDISGLSTGIYLIIIDNNKEMRRARFMKR
jgi:hypothetical protein